MALTVYQRRRLGAIIKGLVLIRDKYLAKNHAENNSPDIRFKGICACINKAMHEDEITYQTHTDIDNIVKTALNQHGHNHTWITEVVADLNPDLRQDLVFDYGNNLQYKVRHMWVNQLIRDYMRMLETR